MLGEVLDREQGLGPRRIALRRGPECAIPGRDVMFEQAHRRTSMAWRRPSLIRLKHMEVMKIMTPGSAATRGDAHIPCRRLLSIRPHSALGGVTPRPRKLRPAARMMQMLMRLVA